MNATLPSRYDDAFLSAYLDGRFSQDDPLRQAFEAQLAVNSALNEQVSALAGTRAQLQALAEHLDASPRLPNLTEKVMARFRQQFGGLASPGGKGALSSQNPAPWTCGQTTPPMICAWLDGELPMAQQTLLNQHLNTCSLCRHTAEDLRLLSQKLRHIGFSPETALPQNDPWPGIEDHLVYGIAARTAQSSGNRYEPPRNFSASVPNPPSAPPFGLALRIVLVLMLALWLWSVFGRTGN